MPPPRFFALISLICLSAVAWPLSAAEIVWPGWRGPGRDGWVSGFQPPQQWPERLKRAWQVEVGDGYASPIVAGDRVYQHARQGEEEVVWCLDLGTGDVVWHQSYPVPFKIGGGGDYHGKGPKSSPALAGGKLFTLSIAGVLSAWDADSGKLLWRRDYSPRFGDGHPYWGASTSPLVDGDHVVVHFGTDGQGALIALHADTGEEAWSYGNEGASYASPILAKIQEVDQIVELNMVGLAGVDRATGRQLWTFSYPQVGSDQNMVTPAFAGGLVLLGGENRGILGLAPQRENGVWTVVERWRQPKVALNMSSAVVNGDLLYGFSHYDKGRLFCLDIQTGKILWESPGRTGDNVTFLAIPGYVLALINDGELQVIAASGERFNKVVSYRVAESPTWAPPVLLERGILVKDSKSLMLWTLEDLPAPSKSR